MSRSDSALLTPLNTQEEKAESQKPVMSMQVEESHGISPATCDLLKKMVAVHRRMSTDEVYRKEIAKKLSWMLTRP